jgi:hypothetical protein
MDAFVLFRDWQLLGNRGAIIEQQEDDNKKGSGRKTHRCHQGEAGAIFSISTQIGVRLLRASRIEQTLL